MSKTDISAENLAIWRKAAADNRTLRQLQMMMLGTDAATALREGNMLLSAFGHLPCARVGDDAYWQAMTTDERVALCRAILQNDPTQGALKPQETPMPTAPRIAMLPGAAFAAAFDCLADCLTDAVVLYHSSLGELLEETAAENADFCLYPIEDAKGTHFLHFYEEFDRLELSPVLGCTVTRDDALQGDRFLLLSKKYRPAPSTGSIPTVAYRLHGEDQRTLLELLTAADLMQCTLRRLDALPAPYPEDSFCYFPVISATQEQILHLNTYVSLFMPRVSVIAEYHQLTEKQDTKPTPTVG